MHTPWSAFAVDDPELAAKVAARFAANLHHILGTLRPDGSPRLSGTEVKVADGELTLGMMPDSLKLRDVRRDPRVELHSAPIETDLAGGDARVQGRLVHTGDIGDGEGSAFAFDLASVTLVQVDGQELVVTSWRPERGTTVTRRR